MSIWKTQMLVRVIYYYFNRVLLNEICANFTLFFCVYAHIYFFPNWDLLSMFKIEVLLLSMADTYGLLFFCHPLISQSLFSNYNVSPEETFVFGNEVCLSITFSLSGLFLLNHWSDFNEINVGLISTLPNGAYHKYCSCSMIFNGVMGLWNICNENFVSAISL